MELVRYRYSVVSFIDLPYKEIKWYICVPNSWVRTRITKERVVVAYPTESPEVTRKRVKKRQKYAQEWNEYTALLRYETDYFDDATIFIQSKSEPMATSNRGIVLPTTSSSDRKRRSSRRKDSSNPKMKPQMSVAPFKGDEQSVMKLTIRRTTSLPVRRQSSNRPKTKKTNITNRFECTNENYFEEIRRHEITAERHNRESFGDINNERNPASGTDQSVNPRKITEQEFINNFCDLMRNFNTICTDTRSMINNLNETFIKSEETLDNVLRSVNNYSKSNSNNTTASTSKASEKRANKNQNKKDDDINDEDYDNDVASDSDNDGDGDSTDDIDKNDHYVITKNNTPKIKRNAYIRTFVLPPDYDPNDSKWTLKHRSYKPGLVEVMPQSGVFVDAIQFANCKRLSTDCKTLARKLLLEIFSRNALSVCSLTGHRSNVFTVAGGDVRPGLDEYARTLLFTFVEEYGRERGWNVLENQSVVNSVRSKIQEIRAKFGKTK